MTQTDRLEEPHVSKLVSYVMPAVNITINLGDHFRWRTPGNLYVLALCQNLKLNY